MGGAQAPPKAMYTKGSSPLGQTPSVNESNFSLILKGIGRLPLMIDYEMR
jgi:hypothetical protein